MSARELYLSFEGATVADGNRYSEDLRSQLLDADPGLSVERIRTDDSTMDFGATLVLVLGAPATVAAARAILAWAKRNNRASIVVKTRSGTLVAKNLESKDVAEVAKALSG
jgi:hypothetical protein